MKKHHLSIVGILFLGYFITILIGTILLLLPISKNITEKTEWYDAMFAATSATCVTGLIHSLPLIGVHLVKLCF